eukprot:Sspe_Gene.92959::Locus_65696_Transcript_1_1_Confidence_1.000_Length_2565::g.92959::m.92959
MSVEAAAVVNTEMEGATVQAEAAQALPSLAALISASNTNSDSEKGDSPFGTPWGLTNLVNSFLMDQVLTDEHCDMTEVGWVEIERGSTSRTTEPRTVIRDDPSPEESESPITKGPIPEAPPTDPLTQHFGVEPRDYSAAGAFCDPHHESAIPRRNVLASGASWLLRMMKAQKDARCPAMADASTTTGDVVFSENLLNTMAACLWSPVSDHLSSLLRRAVETALRSGVGGGVLRLTNFSLGRRSPSLSKLNLQSLDDDSVRIDTDVEWEADADISIDAGPGTGVMGVSAGVDQITLAGRITIIIGPPRSVSPFLGAVDVFFANPPQVELRLTGLGSLAGGLPSVNKAVRRAVDDALAGVCVLPKRVIVPLANTTPLEIARLRSPGPVGVMSIKLLRAFRLPSTFSSSASILSPFTSSDCLIPRVQISIGSKSWTSPPATVASQGASHSYIWPPDAVHLFPIHCYNQGLTIQVLDQYDNVITTALASLNPPDPSYCELSAQGPTDVALDPEGVLRVNGNWLREEETVELDDEEENYHRAPPLAIQLRVELGCGVVHPPPAGPLRVRACASGVAGGPEVTAVSGLSQAKWARGDQLGRSELLQSTLKRLLLRKTGIEEIASVLDLSIELVKEYVANAENPPPDPEAWLADWHLRARADAEAKAAAAEPQFAEVLHLLLPAAAAAITLELVDTKGETVAMCSKGITGGDVEGPFTLRAADVVGSEQCLLDARITSKPLQLDTPAERE